MIKVSIKMPRLDIHEISIKCPRCRLSARVTLGGIRHQVKVVCRGCKADLRFKDQRAGALLLLKSFDRLGEALARLGRR